MAKFTITLLIIFLLSPSGWTQSVPKGLFIQEDTDLSEKANYKPLSLTDVIEQGLRKNYDQLDRKFRLESLQLNWDNTWESFWLPEVKFTLNSASQRVARVRKGSFASSRSKTTSGALALELGNYTLFNWGKDFLEHQNSRDEYLNSRRNLTEDRRSLRYQLILSYFELLYLNKVLELRREQLQQASFVYRYNREKISLRKISREEYYQSRTEYLNAQNDYQEARILKEQKDEAVAILIVDEPGTRYILKDEILYQRMGYSLQSAIELGERDSPTILDAKIDVRQAQRELKVARLENLPLPKFDLNLGAYTHSFGTGVHQTRYSTGLDGSNLDIVASVSATWTLFGTNGFMNQRRTSLSMIDRQRSFNRLKQSVHNVKTEIQKAFIAIKYFENHIRVLEAKVPTARKLYDSVLDNYLNKKTRYLDFQDALNDLITTQIQMAQYQLLHMQNKLVLAELIGKDNIPGENFEKMVTPKRRKK